MGSCFMGVGTSCLYRYCNGIVPAQHLCNTYCACTALGTALYLHCQSTILVPCALYSRCAGAVLALCRYRTGTMSWDRTGTVQAMYLHCSHTVLVLSGTDRANGAGGYANTNL